MKIGEAIQAVRRSELETKRILSSVIEGIGKPAEIYSRYSPSHENDRVWAIAQKKMKITGFRPGKAKAVILPRVQKGIMEGNSRAIEVFWMIYFNCVVAFLRKEHANLNQLLLDRDLESDPDSTEQLLTAIKNVSVLYDVSDSQIEDLYEAYWFERIEGFKGITSQGDIDLDIVKELINKSEIKQKETLALLQKELKKAGPTSNTTLEIDNLKNEISMTANKLEVLKEGFDLEAAKIERSFAELIEGRISELERKQISNNDQVKKEQIENRVALNQENIDRLNKKIQTLTIEKERKKSSKNRSVVSNAADLTKRLNKLSEVNSFSVEHSLLLRDLLNAQGAFYIESDDVFSTICYELINENRVKEIVLSPSKYEFSEEEYEDFLSYDAIYLKNISSAFIEGTVLPVLIKSNSVINKDFPKVFVEFDSELNSVLESQIRKNSMDLTLDVLDQINELEVMKAPGSDHERRNQISSYYIDVHKVLLNYNMYLDRQIYERMIKVGQVVSEYSTDEITFNFSLMVVLIPYVHSNYGELKAQVVVELLNGFIAR